MKKTFLLSLFVASFFLLKSQTKNHHIVGLNVEFEKSPEIINSHFGSNLTYLYAYKYFCSRLEVGVSPTSNFGPLIKTCLNFGYTTNLNMPISFHLLGGIGGQTTTKTYVKNNTEYDAEIGSVDGSVGLLIRPTKNERLFVGTDMMMTFYSVYPKAMTNMNSINAKTYTGTLFFFNLSINYKLNKIK